MPSTMIDAQRIERWSSEAAYFDAEAERVYPRPVADETLQRYGARPPRMIWQKEFRFRLLGDLAGKRVLDVGCGYGANVSLLARLGAQVTGIDVSPRAIEVAKSFAWANGVADRVELMVSPIETAELPESSFDVIWGDAVLHHLLADLDLVLSRLARWAKPGALMVFAEPLSLSKTLRRVRLALPIPLHGTPSERPLEPADCEIISRHVDELAIRPFSFFTRLIKQYETQPATHRFVADALATLDWALLSVPVFAPLAGTAVLWGRPRK